MASKEQLAALMEQTETLAITRERMRILEELEKRGPTGDYFEMRWAELIDLIAPKPFENSERTSTNK